jgi:hypothetical protein
MDQHIESQLTNDVSAPRIGFVSSRLDQQRTEVNQ